MKSIFGICSLFTLLTMTQIQVAEACSPPNCNFGRFIPGGGSIPGTLNEFQWIPTEAGTPEDVILMDQNGNQIPISLTTNGPVFIFSVDAPLVVGNRYELMDSSVCGDGENSISGPESSFLITEAVPLPTELGTLTASDLEIKNDELPTVSGSCTSPATYVESRIELRVTDEALPWSRLTKHVVMVNGMPHKWLTTDRSTNLIRVCESDDDGLIGGLPGGDLEIHFEATILGTDMTLATPPISINLLCPGEDSIVGDCDELSTAENIPEECRDVAIPEEEVDAMDQDGGCSQSNNSSGWFILLFLSASMLRRKTSLSQPGRSRIDCPVLIALTSEYLDFFDLKHWIAAL